MSKHRIGLYPGTFDPITFGHIDIITRAMSVVDHLVVAVATNEGKGPLYGTDARVALVEAEMEGLRKQGHSIEVRSFDTLLMNFAIQIGATAIVRGLRAVSDFEYEFQMAGMNHRLNPKIETVFLMASDKYQFISSRFVKEIARVGGEVRHFVSPMVADALAEEFRHAK